MAEVVQPDGFSWLPVNSQFSIRNFAVSAGQRATDRGRGAGWSRWNGPDVASTV